jgi:superkiller protein 3
MLNPSLEKQNDERLITKEEIPTRIASPSPFESIDDIILSGKISSINKGEATFRPRETIVFAYENKELSSTLKNNQITNALKDLKGAPNNPFLLNNLGLTYLRNRELDGALESFKQAIELKRDFTIASLNLASVYTMKNEKDLAMDIYKNLLNKKPDDTRVLINVGNIYFGDKKFKEAKGIYKEVIKIDPKNITARNRLAIIDLIEGKYTKAISQFRECLHVNTNLPAIYNNLGVAYGATGSYKKAIRSFKTVLNLFPDYTSAIFNLATALKLKNNVISAIELLEEWLRKNENMQIRELLSGLYVENEQYPKALKTLTVALKNAMEANFPDLEIARLHNNIGVIYHNIRDFKNAEDNYLECMKKAGFANQIILGNIIDLYFALNKIDKAKEYTDIFYDKFGTGGLYSYYIALHNYYNQELPESMKFINIFLKTNKKFAPAYALLSNIYSDYMQEYKKAIELNREGINHLPNDLSIIDNLAYNYLMNDEIDNAKAILDRVKDVTNNVFLTATSGLLRIKEGDIEEGTKFYNLAAHLANNEFLRNQVLQKKHIELARYYLLNNNKDKAKANLEKALSIKIRNNIYTIQADELYQKLV